ncbi:MAG: hypothetical protein ACI86H_002246 [bacterium]|jgi:hypothetical protein
MGFCCSFKKKRVELIDNSKLKERIKDLEQEQALIQSRIEKQKFQVLFDDQTTLLVHDGNGGCFKVPKVESHNLKH